MVLDFDTYVFETLLNEGLLVTYPANKVVGYIQKKYKLGDGDIDIDYDEFTDNILISKSIKENESLYNEIEHILKSSGYYFGKTEGVNDEIIVFERKFDEDVFSKLKESGEIKYLYHVSPSKNDVKIKSNGLIPHSKNHRFGYPERIYFFVDSDKGFLNRMCDTLYRYVQLGLLKTFKFDTKKKKEYMERTHPNEYSVYRVDFQKLNNIKLYRDPNAGNFEAYYTYDNISPDIIEKIDDIKL